MAKAGVITIDLDAGTSQFILDLEKANAKLKGFGSAAEDAGKHTVTSMQASSAAIRELAGGSNIRAVERLITTIPGIGKALQFAFPLVGGLAFGTLLVDLGGKAIEFYKKVEEGPQRVAAAFRELNAPLQLTNDELQLSNDRLSANIAKLEGKHQNTLKIELDEATVAAQKLAEGLDKDLTALNKLLKQEQIGALGSLIKGAETSDLADQLKNFQNKGVDPLLDQRSDAISKARTPDEAKSIGADYDRRLKAVYDTEIDRLKNRLGGAKATQEVFDASGGTAGRVARFVAGNSDPAGAIQDQGVNIEETQAALRSLQRERTFIGLSSDHDDLNQKNTGLEASKAAREKETQDLRKQDEERLAQLKASHQLSVGEVIQYWKARLAAESSNVDRTREITITLGNLYQERDKLIASVSQHGAELIRADAKKAEKELSDIAKFAVEAQDLIDSSGVEITDKNARLASVEAKRQGDIGAAGAKGDQLEAERGQSLGVQTLQSRVVFMGRIAGLEAQQRDDKIAALALEATSLDSEGKTAEAAAKRGEADKLAVESANDYYAAQTKILEVIQQQNPALAAQKELAQTLTDWSKIGFGDIEKDLVGAAVKLPGELASSLADSIFSPPKRGESKGQEVLGGLAKTGENVGKQLFTQVLTQAIEKMIAQLIGQAAIASLQTSAQTANTAALTALTTAVAANTATQGASAAGGVAGGVGSAAGGIAGGVGSAVSGAATGFVGPLISAAGGIIGGIISAVSTWIGDNKIVKAVDGTTAAVNALGSRLAGPITTSTTNGATPGSPATPNAPGWNPFASLLNGFTGGGSAIDVNVVSISPLAPLAGFFKLLGFADGTDSAPGGLSLVGERGPELMNIPRGAQIIPNHALGGFAMPRSPYAMPRGGYGGTAAASSSSNTYHGGHTFNGDIHLHDVQDVRSMMRGIADYAKNSNPSKSPFSD